MADRRYSDEDLRALLAYIASNPAILFPALNAEERDALVNDVLEQYDQIQKADESREPDLIVKSIVYSEQKPGNFCSNVSDVKLFIGDVKQPK